VSPEEIITLTGGFFMLYLEKIKATPLNPLLRSGEGKINEKIKFKKL